MKRVALCRRRAQIAVTQRENVESHTGESAHVAHSILPNSDPCDGGHWLRRSHRTNIVGALQNGAGREVDNKAMGGGEEGVGQGQEKMGRLPEAIERTEA